MQLESKQAKLVSDFSSMSVLTEAQVNDLLQENARALRNKELEIEPLIHEVRVIDSEFERNQNELRDAFLPQIDSHESEFDKLEAEISQDQVELNNLTEILLSMKDRMKSTMIEFVKRVSEDEIGYWNAEEENLKAGILDEEDSLKLLTKKALETSAALSILNPKFEEQVGKALKTSKVLQSMLESQQHEHDTNHLELDTLKRVISEKMPTLQRLREETNQLSSMLSEGSEAMVLCGPLLTDRMQQYDSGELEQENKDQTFTSNRFCNKLAGLVNIFDRELRDQARLIGRLNDRLSGLDGHLKGVQSKISVLQGAIQETVARGASPTAGSASH
jgi:hypothetical protein